MKTLAMPTPERKSSRISKSITSNSSERREKISHFG
jgi:hypothetical protein